MFFLDSQYDHLQALINENIEYIYTGGYSA